jgi:hypothetical protein
MNSGAIPPLPDTSSWHDAKLIRHRDNFTVLYFETHLVSSDCALSPFHEKLW